MVWPLVLWVSLVWSFDFYLSLDHPGFNILDTGFEVSNYLDLLDQFFKDLFPICHFLFPWFHHIDKILIHWFKWFPWIWSKTISVLVLLWKWFPRPFWIWGRVSTNSIWSRVAPKWRTWVKWSVRGKLDLRPWTGWFLTGISWKRYLVSWIWSRFVWLGHVGGSKKSRIWLAIWIAC